MKDGNVVLTVLRCRDAQTWPNLLPCRKSGVLSTQPWFPGGYSSSGSQLISLIIMLSTNLLRDAN